MVSAPGSENGLGRLISAAQELLLTCVTLNSTFQARCIGKRLWSSEMRGGDQGVRSDEEEKRSV